MPNLDLSGLLIIIFALIPGILACETYTHIVGRNWRDEKTNDIVKYVYFSFIGLAIYLLICNFFKGLPYPIYLQPNTFSDKVINLKENTSIIILALVLHSVCAIIAGLVFGKVVNFYNDKSKRTTYPDTWDEFCCKYVKNRWVIVGLKDGKSYAGMIEHVDIHVNHGERDLILDQPAEYDGKCNYRGLNYRYLFLPGKMINSIGAVDSNEDNSPRILKVGELLFKETVKKEGINDA